MIIIKSAIVEEVCKAIFYKKPVFLLGAAGGATRWLIDRIVNQDIESINLNGNHKCIDEIKSALKNFTIENLSDLNKLQSAENEKLFYSYDIKEVINTLFNGLMRIQ